MSASTDHDPGRQNVDDQLFRWLDERVQGYRVAALPDSTDTGLTSDKPIKAAASVADARACTSSSHSAARGHIANLSIRRQRGYRSADTVLTTVPARVLRAATGALNRSTETNESILGRCAHIVLTGQVMDRLGQFIEADVVDAGPRRTPTVAGLPEIRLSTSAGGNNAAVLERKMELCHPRRH
jgi:hypothetical protein